MSIAINLLLIILAINIMLFLSSLADIEIDSCSGCSPIFSVAYGFATGDYTTLVDFLISWKALAVYTTLMGFILFAAYASGSVGVSGIGGSGQAAPMTLQLLAISAFTAISLMPNFSTLGFPLTIEVLIDVVFGGMIVVTIVSLLKG